MEICNVVSSYSLPIDVCLKHIHKELRPISVRKRDFPSVSLRLNKSELCQIFKNGKMIVIEGRSIEQNTALFADYVELLQYLGYNFRPGTPVIQNIVARYVHPG